MTATHDFNGDVKSDMLWRDTSGNVGMWLMNGSSISTTSVLGNVPGQWSVVGQRDFNGDGNGDVLWRDTSGNVGMWLMNGKTIQSSTVLGNVPNTWSVAATGDFNGDGMGDILWRDTSGNVGMWLMNGTSILQTAVIGNVPTNWVDRRSRHPRRHILAQLHHRRSRNVGHERHHNRQYGGLRGSAADLDDCRHWRL